VARNVLKMLQGREIVIRGFSSRVKSLGIKVAISGHADLRKCKGRCSGYEAGLEGGTEFSALNSSCDCRCGGRRGDRGDCPGTQPGDCGQQLVLLRDNGHYDHRNRRRIADGLEDRLPEASEEAESRRVGEAERGVADTGVAVPALRAVGALDAGVGAGELESGS
jgi:hypothetical protein